MNKEMLAKKKESLQKSLESLLQQQVQLNEQIVMHRGAIQYNDMLVKELDDEEAAKAAAAQAEAGAPDLKAVE